MTAREISRIWTVIFMLLSLSPIASTASAEILETNPEERARLASSSPRLAWISTRNAVLDSEIASGLKRLTDYLWKRTSVTPASPILVDPAIDALMLYPLIYWGISTAESITLSNHAIERLRDFLHQGGLLVVDTRDAGQSRSLLLSDIEPILKPPLLVPLAKDHVLLRSFYILPDLIGRYGRGKNLDSKLTISR